MSTFRYTRHPPDAAHLWALLRVTKATVGKWRTRFVAKRLDELRDERRRSATDWSTRAIAAGCSKIVLTVERFCRPIADSSR